QKNRALLAMASAIEA
ncbi:hypothetical protein ACNVD4_24255, partial [Rhizobium sp. BR5]